MYIFELFTKWINKNKRGTNVNPNNIFKEGIILDEDGEIIKQPTDESINCKHKFMPVDSTGNILACINCGFVIKKRESKKDKS